MSYTNELLDKYKAAVGAESDYAAAKALGIRPNRLSNYRTGVSHADDKTAVMLADALGLDRLQTIARINMDRARDSKERAFWRHIAAAAAIAAVAFVSIAAAPHAQVSDALAFIPALFVPNAYYVNAAVAGLAVASYIVLRHFLTAPRFRVAAT